MSATRYLLDEHVDPTLRAQLSRHEPDLTVWIIGDPGGPQCGALDPDVLLWCEANGFSLVTNNRKSMAVHLRDHLAAGHHVPGMFVLNPNMTMGATIEELRLIWGASEPEEYRDLLLVDGKGFISKRLPAASAGNAERQQNTRWSKIRGRVLHCSR